MTKLQIAEQMRKALQMYCETLTDDEAMIIPAVYDEWEVGVTYKAKKILRYGTNGVGDPQLYRVEQGHTSQMGWPPDGTPALYTPIGVTSEGYAIWAQPTGAHDAYAKGDIVWHNGVLYISTMEANVYEPGVYGWDIYEEGEENGEQVTG